ncbi:hypothetical protein T12_5135 [Trichinella patagoniensis]|uniref:Uncharacterized protein n=1 Tax=Trichinella patagoniensis TaxID=990121 RepID=A0A0V1A7J1_9BILA|nr:hypothetical protein T12_5135 [Trichinella patagoniensis]
MYQLISYIRGRERGEKNKAEKSSWLDKADARRPEVTESDTLSGRQRRRRTSANWIDQLAHSWAPVRRNAKAAGRPAAFADLLDLRPSGPGGGGTHALFALANLNLLANDQKDAAACRSTFIGRRSTLIG